MSVIANYVRVSDEQLSAWRSNPNFMNEVAAGRVPGAEHCDIDKAYQAVAWLLSPAKREEQRRYAGALAGTGEVDADYSDLAPDLLLAAIEGRSADDKREPQIEYGLGEACVFAPSFVEEIDRALSAITREAFRENFSPEVMMEQMVDPEIWDEGEGVLDEFLFPAFERLREFFARAAAAKQNVVVVYT
jgi:hypothetical protein